MTIRQKILQLNPFDQALTGSEEELQTLGSLLADGESHLLKCRDSQLLRAAFRPLVLFTCDKSHALSLQVLGKLKVCHYGAVRRYIRELIGIISYHKIQDIYASDAFTVQSVASCNAAGKKREVCRELISEDWAPLQDLAIGVDGEFVMIAAALLQHQEKLKAQDEDQSSSMYHNLRANEIIMDDAEPDKWEVLEPTMHVGTEDATSTFAIAQAQHRRRFFSSHGGRANGGEYCRRSAFSIFAYQLDPYWPHQ